MATILYDKKVNKELAEKLGRTNPHALPRIQRVIVNAGIGKRVSSDGKKVIELIDRDLARITGQKPVIRKAKKSIATFKLREGTPTGMVVTLRGARADAFLTRLIKVALPRMRDFRGIKRSAIDASGNIHIGIAEQTIFPEAAEDPTGILFSFQVTAVTTARNNEEGEQLFRLLGFPIALPEEEE